MNTRLNGEDGYNASRRGEGTSRFETHLESTMEGFHAEDHPELVGMIKTAQEGAEAAEEELQQKWLAAQADGSVKIMDGEPDFAKLVVPRDADNEIDALRKLRLAQMKGKANARQAWLAKGHGKYVQLEQESSFLEQLPQHERVVCALAQPGSLDGEMLHGHMRALCRVHVETYFCWLDPERAPVMMGMVDVGRLPVLLLCRDGKVVDKLHDLDRSFTTEGVAFELGSRQFVEFEEGTHYESVGAACTTATAGRAAARRPRTYEDSDDDDDSAHGLDDDDTDIDD